MGVLKSFRRNEIKLIRTPLICSRTMNKFRHFAVFKVSILHSIYFTSFIKAFIKEIKRYAKRKKQLLNENVLDRFLISQFSDYDHTFNISIYRSLIQQNQKLYKCMSN